MKKFFACFIALLSISVVLNACSNNPDFSVSDSSASFPVQITELTDEQREILSAEYTPTGYDEGIALSNASALNLYDAMNFDNYKEIIPEKSFYENLNNINDISFWFFTDRNEMLTGSRGCFSIYENDIVYYSPSPVISHCEYYKAPHGTYDAIKAIIDSSISN